MPELISTLDLVWRTREGGGGKTEFQYLDFMVDGQSMHDLLRAGDQVGVLGWSGWNEPDYEQDLADVLLLRKPSNLFTGRALLYVCAECGDIGCGVITVSVEKKADCFVWRDFGYENDYDPELPDLKEYTGIGPFYFNKSNYWSVLTHRPTTPSG